MPERGGEPGGGAGEEQGGGGPPQATVQPTHPHTSPQESQSTLQR